MNVDAILSGAKIIIIENFSLLFFITLYFCGLDILMYSAMNSAFSDIVKSLHCLILLRNFLELLIFSASYCIQCEVGFVF